jgi:hypothetical protein
MLVSLCECAAHFESAGWCKGILGQRDSQTGETEFKVESSKLKGRDPERTGRGRDSLGDDGSPRRENTAKFGASREENQLGGKLEVDLTSFGIAFTIG